jgi:ATP-dependent Clp protease ATP-binding subunit ClpA
MFERFTDRARRAVVLAQEESRRLNHHHIGVEHLLLGMLAEGEGVAARALTELGVDLDAVRSSVAESGGVGATPPQAHIPFSDAAKSTMEGALREALKLGHNYIGTEHLLLGMIGEQEGLMLLDGLGLTAPAVRTATIAALSVVITQRPPAGDGPPTGAAYESSHTPGLQLVLGGAARHAGDEPVGTHHVVAAIAEADNVAGHAVLSAGGFSTEALPTRPEQWDTAGTLDDTPTRVASRGTEIVVGDEGVQIRFTDPDRLEQLRLAVSQPEFTEQLRSIIARAIEDSTSAPDEPEGEDPDTPA